MGRPFSYQITASGTVPITFEATDLPAGLRLSGDTISGIPTVSGIFFIITLKATNSAGSDRLPLYLNIVRPEGGNNVAPVFTSLPTANPNPGIVGVAVNFSAVATDDNGDNITYDWNFGDKTFSAGANVSHTYTTAGIYIVTVTICDGVASDSRTIHLGVNSIDGTNTDPSLFQVKKASLTFNFKPSATKSDTLILTGTLPVASGFAPKDKTLTVTFGDYQNTFTLDAKGKATSGTDTIKLTGKMQTGAYLGSLVKFTYTVKKQSLFKSLESFGFSNDNISEAEEIGVPTLFTLDDDSYLNIVTMSYTAKKDKRGVGKK
ncbi:MAG: PKD domain-containing protein [Planctomycetota bacterium]